MEAIPELPVAQLRARYKALRIQHAAMMAELKLTKDKNARNQVKDKIRPIQEEIHVLVAKINGSRANDSAAGDDFHASAAIATASTSEHQAGAEEATSWGEPDPGAKNTWPEPGFGAKETWDYPDSDAEDNQASEVEFAPSITHKELRISPLTNYASNSSEWGTPLKAIQLNFPSNPLYILWT